MMDEKLMGLETEDIRVKGVLKGRQESFLRNQLEVSISRRLSLYMLPYFL